MIFINLSYKIYLWIDFIYRPKKQNKTIIASLAYMSVYYL